MNKKNTSKINSNKSGIISYKYDGNESIYNLDILDKLTKELGVNIKTIAINVKILKESIDARKKNDIFYLKISCTLYLLIFIFFNYSSSISASWISSSSFLEDFFFVVFLLK